MKEYKHDFLDFVTRIGVLKFGEFTLKSGRVSPYFFNTGMFNTGGRLAQLGAYYTRALLDSGVEFDMLYGPAYKGIPLVVATSVAFYNSKGKSIPYAFNRKEAKDHGEGGDLIGSPIAGRIIIVDDVITSGTSINESMKIINRSGDAIPVGVVISMDRQEIGLDGTYAIEEVLTNHGIPVISIVTLDDLVEYMEDCSTEISKYLPEIKHYQDQYGIR